MVDFNRDKVLTFRDIPKTVQECGIHSCDELLFPLLQLEGLRFEETLGKVLSIELDKDMLHAVGHTFVSYTAQRLLVKTLAHHLCYGKSEDEEREACVQINRALNEVIFKLLLKTCKA